MEKSHANSIIPPTSSLNGSANEVDAADNVADARHSAQGADELKSNHKPPKISFSENSSSLIRCMPNERATFFVKIDTEDDDADILPLDFEWSRGEVPIYNSDRFRISKTSNAVQLAVEHVQREDAGHYTLFARTKSNDVIRKDVQLIVEDRSTGEDPPKFARRLKDLQVRVGSSTRLITEIRSSTDVKLTWFRNDRRICPSDRIKEIYEGLFYYLEINPVTLEDGGQWMVMAENYSGRNSCIANLTVIVPKAYKAPEFIEELKAILTQQGTVSLECKVVGVPTPQLRWFKDSKEIKAGDVFALTANVDDPTSLGTYTCEAVNCVGKAYSSSKLHVVGRGSREGSLKPADSVTNSAPPPIFTNELKNASVRIGETIILGCQVAVPPWPQSVVWYNKCGRVDSGDRYKYIEDGLGVYMIEVKPSEACDEGEWKCVVTNEESCVGISTCTVNMEIPKNYRKPRFMENLKAVLTEEGLVSFECKVVGFPTPLLKWFKDGQELKPGDVYQLTGTNSLGTYCCIAQNCMGESSSVAVLTVEDIQNQLNEEERLTFAASTSQPPKFLIGLKSQETKINEPFQFVVKVEATPSPLLSWFRDELPIESNDRYNQYSGEENNWHLDIRCVQFIDQAEWKCVAVNDFGTTVTSCFLKLQIPKHYKKPRFLECLRAILTEEGAVNLECKVIGVPQPMLKWYKDGVELKPGDIHKIISGQDGTCCLGTYTCEARNCMGVVASSAALLGFEDEYSKQETQQQNELQRNFSLSTIQEEHTSQLYETPQGDITITDKGDVSFSFDGKEVSVSLYETPDLTEEEALKIVEMYADQISEHVTEHNIVELPPLRFVKETSQSGKLLMEAVVIDISPEYFSHEEDLRTEAGVDDISINEITIHGSSLKDEEEVDKQTEDFARNSFEKMEEELSLTAPTRKRKKSKLTETEDFVSFSKTSDGSVDENTSELQTFASAQNSKIESMENESASESVQAPLRKKGKKQTDSESSKTTETEAQFQDISGAVGDGLKVISDKPLKIISNEVEIEKNLKSLLPLAKLLKVLDGHLNAVESEVVNQSVMLMTPASADQSIAIIKNIIDPLSQIQSKLKVYSGETPLDALFETMSEDVHQLHVALQVIEKCVEIDETGTTLIQRTSVCIIDSLADHLIKALEEVRTISETFENEILKSHLQLTVDDIKQGLEITKDTIKSQVLLQEAQEIEATKHFTETVAKLQEVPEALPFAEVAEADMPKFSESVKTICEPVLKIQAALEKVENELTLEETDEDIYKKVHGKIMLNLVQPINELQAVVAQISKNTSSMTARDIIEQKVNMAILDIVSPPLFELNKGLEVILQQPSNDIEAGKLTVSTVESMVPPLQEIQNGLAQLSQDILTGQITDDQLMDTDDLKKLLQSLAQAVLHLETNIEHISTRLPENVSFNLSTLREAISSLIGQVMDRDLDKYHLTVLENIKKPIDELNYCIRQIEQKSISGSITDLVDPLHSLKDKVVISQDILKLSTIKQSSDVTDTLDKMHNLIKTIEIDIEENELKNIKKETALDEEQTQNDDKLFLLMRQEMEMKIELEQFLEDLEKMCGNLKTLNSIEFLEKELKTHFTSLAKPYEQLVKNLKSQETDKNSLQSAMHFVRSTAKALEKVNNSMEELFLQKDKKEFSRSLNGNCRHDLEELKNSIDQMENYEIATAPVANLFNEVLVVLENILPKLVEEAAKEDVSTLEDISALKSNAESLPSDSIRDQAKEIEKAVPTGPLKSFEDKKLQVEKLLGQLKNSIASVLAHCHDYDMGSLRIEQVEQMKATVNKMEEFKQCLEHTIQPQVHENVQSISELSDVQTMAEAVGTLENCALQIQEYIDNFDVKDLSRDEISELKTMALPLKDLVEGVKVFYNQELEQVETLKSLTSVSLTSAQALQSLRSCVLAMHEHQALETLESLADNETFSHLKELVQPLHELEKAIICIEENQLLTQVSNISDATSLDNLKSYAQPLLSLKEAIVNIKQEQLVSRLEDCPSINVIKEKAGVLFEVLKYCESLDTQIFSNVEDLSTFSVTDIKSFAELNTVSENSYQPPVQTRTEKVKVFDLKDCVAGGIKQIEECLNSTKSIQDIEVASLEDIMQELKNGLQQMESQLLKTTQKTEDLIEKETQVAKTMYKLKECLVHTYESTGLETGLEDIEKTFEDLLQAMPSLELQLALEMKEKIVLELSEFIVACIESNEANVDTLIQPFRNLMETVEVISKLNKLDVETSSSVMVQLQTQLMTAFRVINDLSEKSNQKILPSLLKTQNILVSVYDFIENNEGNLRIIELLQEIDYLTPELGELKTSFSLAKQRLSEAQVQELFDNVNSAKLFLTEAQEGLMQNDPLVQTFMQENRETVEKLQTTLIQVESKLQSATIKDIEQDEAMQALSDLLNDVKANIEKLQSSDTSEPEKSDIENENLKQAATDTTDSKMLEDKAETNQTDVKEQKYLESDVSSKKDQDTYLEPDVSSKKDEDKSTEVERDISTKEAKEVEIPKPEADVEETKAQTVVKTTEKQLAPSKLEILQLINGTNSYLQSLPTSNVEQSTLTFVASVAKNLKEIQSAIEAGDNAAFEDRLFLPLFKSKELINIAMNFDATNETADIILQNLKKIVLLIVNENPKLRKSLLFDIIEPTKSSISYITKYIAEEPQQSELSKNLSQAIGIIVGEMNAIYQNNQGNLTQSSEAFNKLKESLCQLKDITAEINNINSNVLKTTKLDQIVEKLRNKEINDAFEILLELENIQDMFKNMLQILKSQPSLLRKSTQESITNALEKLSHEDNLQALKSDLQELSATSTNDQKRKCIFKLREHIVHTYDGSLKDDLENIIDSVLDNNPDLIQSINADYLKTINENITTLNLQINSLLYDNWQPKLNVLPEKLSNIQSVAEHIQMSKDVEKSSAQMIEMQKNLMDVFVLFDDMVDETTPNINLDLEQVKTLSLSQYDAVEHSKDRIKTITIYTNIIDLCSSISKALCKITEKSQTEAVEAGLENIDQVKQEQETASLSELKDQSVEEKAKISEIGSEMIEEKQFDAAVKKPKEEEIKASTCIAEISEIKAEEIERTMLDVEAKHAKDKAFEGKKEKAEKSEVQAGKIEEKKVEIDSKQAQEEHINEQTQKVEISEVMAEKITEQKMQVEATTATVEEIKAVKGKVEISEIKSEKIEEKNLDVEAKKVKEEELQVQLVKAEISEVKVETKEEKQLEIEGKQSVEVEMKTKKEKAEISEIEAEQMEEQKPDTEAKKSKQEEIKAEKLKAEMSEVKAEKIEENKLEVSAKKSKEEEIKAEKRKAEISEVKAEKIEEKKVDTEAKKAKEEEIKTTTAKADITETKPEKMEEQKLETVVKTSKEEEPEQVTAEVSEIKTEKMEETKSETDAKKAKEEEVKAEKGKPKVSEIEAETIEEKNLETLTKKSKEEEIKAEIGKAEISEVKAEKIEEKTLNTEAKKAKEEELKTQKEKAEVSEIKADKIEEQQLETETKKSKEEELKAEKGKAEISEVKAEKIEEKKVNTEAKKAKEEEIKTQKQKAEVSEIKAEKIEEKKLETETKKSKEEELKAEKGKAEISEVTVEKIEEKKLETKAKKTKEEEIKAELRKAEISEVKAEKIEEKKVDTEAKKAKEEEIKTQKEKAEVSEIKAEKIEEKKLKTEAKKTKEEEIKAEKEKAEISEVKAEKIEEKKEVTEVQRGKEEEIKTQKEKTDISEIKAEKIEEKTLEINAKETKNEEIKTQKGKAEVSEIKAEKMEEKTVEIEARKTKEEEIKTEIGKSEISEVKAEKIEVKEVNTEAKKAKEEQVKTQRGKAEVSEIKAEKIEEKKLETEPKKTKEEDIKTEKGKAEISEVTAEKIEKRKINTEAKKAKEEEIKTQKGTAEVSEIKAEKIEEKKLEIEAKKLKAEELKAEKGKAEISQITAQKVEERKLETEAKKIEEEEIKAEIRKAEISEVKAEKIEEIKVNTEAKMAKEEEMMTQKGEAEISEIKADKIEETKLETKAKKTKEEEIKTEKGKAEVSEIKAEKIEEKKLETEAKKPRKEELKAEKEKPEISEIRAEKIEEKKQEIEAKNTKEEDIKSEKGKPETSEIKAENIEENKVSTEAKTPKEEELKIQKEKAEVSEIKAEKIEEKKINIEAKMAKEEEIKTQKGKAEVSEIKADKIEEKKLETEAKKPKEEELKAEKEKAEISDIIAEKIEEKKLEIEAKKTKEEEIEAEIGKPETSDVKAEKLEEKKVITEAKTAKEEEIKTQKGKAEVSEIKAEKIEEKKLETETKKSKEEELKAEKGKAEISEVTAEKIEEKKLETKAKKTKEEEIKAEIGKPETSKVKAEKLEEKKVDTKTKTAKEEEIKTQKEKAEVSEIKAEKLEEKKLETEAKKSKEEELKTEKGKAEISEITAEKMEEKKLKIEAKKTKEEEIKAEIGKAEISEVKAEKIEEKKVHTEAKKAKEEEIKTQKGKTEVSEIKADKIEEKKLETETKKSKEEELKAEKGKGEISETKEEKIEEKKPNEDEMKAKREKSEISEVTPQKVEEKKVDTEPKKAKEEVINTQEENAEVAAFKGGKMEEKKLEIETKKSKEEEKRKAEISEVKEEKKKTKEEEMKEQKGKGDVSKVRDEKIKEKVEDRKSAKIESDKQEIKTKKVEQKDYETEMPTSITSDAKSQGNEQGKLEGKQKVEKSKPINEYTDLKEQRSAKRMPSLDVKLTNRNSSVGSDIKLTCGISGNDLIIRWYKENVAIENSTKFKITQKDGLSSLEIKSADLHDAAVYRCVASNRNGEVETSCLVTLYDVPTNKFGTPPIFTRNIRDAYHSHENHLILECKVSGSPKPNVYWQKDNTLLSEEGNKYKFMDLEDGIRQIVILNPSKEDTGLYTCYAESESGQMKISKFVDVSDYIKKITERRASKLQHVVQEELKLEKANDTLENVDRQEQKLRFKDNKFKLHIESPMKPMTIAAGTKAQLICYVTGLIEDVYWLRDNERVTKDTRHKIYNINGALSLEIYDVRSDDSGVYKCVVRNNRNSIETVCDLSVYDIPTKELPPSFSSPVTATFEPKRCEITLSCNVHGRPAVTWIRDDHTISNNRYRTIEEIGGARKLIIRNPIPADCGTFACFAETNERIESIIKVIKIADLKKLMTDAAEGETNGLAIDIKKHIATTMQTSKQEMPMEASECRNLKTALQRKPLFSTLLNDRRVAEFSNVRLSCSLVYDVCMNIEWLKDNQPLPKDNRYQTIFHNGEAMLEIFAAQESDSGHYICRATNDYGESLSHSQLSIYKHYEDAPQPATFIQSIRDTYSINENELVLECRVRGKPRPEIQWTKGTDILMPGERYVQIDQPDGYSKLIVLNPTEKDSGLYACVARNEVAENKITHQVDFKGRERFAMEKTLGFFHRDPNKPHFLQPLGNQTVCGGGTIAITAEFMQTHTPIEVQWFRERQSLAGQPNVKTFYEKGVYTLAIMNAQPENEGTYTCRAQNAFGRMESHATVDVAIGVSKDERPPLFLSRPETEMKIAVGDPFSISFRIAGDPKPRLTLMKGTKDITKSDRVSKEVSDDYTRFTVQKAQISDSGTYFVVARNNNGTDRIFVTVEVMPRARSETPSAPLWGLPLESYPDVSYFKDPPAAISTEPLLIDAGPTHISLSWGKPPINNSAPVIAYRVDAWIVGHDGGAIWKEVGLTPINSFDAFNLKSNVEYHFRVTPKNRYGWGPSVQTSVPLQVGGVECLPEFTVILPGQVKALLDKEFVLEAVVRGTPRPDIVWYKDGLRISSNVESDRIKTRKIGSTCSLTIKQVTANDEGRYTCEATNSKGRVSTFARLQVVADPKLYEADNRLKEIVRQDNISTIGDTLPIFTMRLRDRRVQVTYPVRLTCQVVGHPQPEVTWFKDDELLQSSRRCLITEENQFYTLELASAQLNDSGIYTCTAKNELGSVSCHCSLVVDKGIRAYISPEFYMPLDPLYIVQEGQELRLAAKVEAYPAVGVSWHRNGAKLRPSRRLACSLDSSGLVELIISEASIRDAGIYTCVASNAVGKQESLCRVCIEPLEENDIQTQNNRTVPAIWTNDMPYSKEPLFVVKPRSSEAFEGDTVIIFCEVVGDPKPDVVWLRDFLKPEYYKDAPHFRRIGEGPEYRLEIPYAKLDFTGTYSVIATNCHGETKAVISLQIFAKDILKQNPMEKGSIRHGNVETLPHFIRHLRNLRCCDGDAITLEAHVEGLPEPIIIWEKDGRVLPSGKDFEMTYDGIKATLSIPRVYPEDEGEYTCIAKNNIGRTLSSACIIVDVPEEKENMLNRQLTRPTAFLSATSTPLSTPRSTPIRSISPTRRLSYRNSVIDINEARSSSSSSRCLIDGRQAIAAPKFLAIPNSRVVEEGDCVRFQCAISGHPMPWSTWDKDGIIVTPTTRIAVKEVNDLRYLDIEEVTFEDAGLYRITLENDYGRIEATARLDVISSSRFTKSPSARSVRASSSKRNGFLHRRIMGPSTAIGGRMALAAGFRGSSVPSCKFYHNGYELQDNERMYIELLQEEAFLFIDNVTKDDEGIYTCIIEGHEHEPIVTSTVVTFLTEKQITEMPETICAIAQPLPKEMNHYESDTIDLCFELKTNMPYTYMWTRNGELLKESDDFNFIDHGNGFLCLRIHDAFDLDSGYYECIVTTIDGFQCSTFTNLNIGRKSESIDDVEGLAIMKSLLPVVADCGVKATFCARIFPLDAPVLWYVCGRMVVENPSNADDSCEYALETSNADGLRVLHINNVTLEHSGEVQLVVTHPGKPYSSLKSYTTLAVIPRPNTAAKLIESTKISTEISTNLDYKEYKNKQQTHQPAFILESPIDCTALIGGCVRLSIIFEGSPKPQVRWFKASRPIVETSNIIINTSSRKSVLQISDIGTDDSGKYTVEVMNEFGTDLAVASVAVEGPPEPPSGKPSISQGPDRVSIAWCGPPYDGGCMITGFIIERQELLPSAHDDSEATWLEIASVVDSLAYTVKDLKPLCTYRFRVRAENVHGRSDPGLPSDRVHINKENEDLTEDLQKPIAIKAGGEFKERFEILEELGKGRFGIVYKVQEKEEPKSICAAKVIKCIKSRDRVKVQEEISIMKSLKHPKLLQLAASFESSREIVMVMEYITGGELFERVVADDFTLTERDCILFVRQVCEGVAYMHSQSIVHLDLKPENIMCKTRTCHQIKIIDFGLAQRLDTCQPVRVLFGTPEFIPPEIISYEPIGFQSDMWSVGVICYVLLSGLSPFMGDSDVETFSNITRADYDFDDDAFDCVSQQAKDFISNLLVNRKEERWTAEQCLESPWLKQGHHDENLGNKKICTDKLKKFIIRRKWQKTGNAIRALGRMATLSASRRNSVASNTGSVLNSPRPSISGISVANPNVSVHMGSLHEEDDDFSIELPTTDIKRKNPKVLNKSQCSERSDSGYSECSNCSATGSVACQCPTNKDSVDNISNDDLSLSVPHDILKLKLEEIAHQADSNIEGVKLKLVVPNEKCLQLDDNQNELKALKFSHTEEKPVQIVEELDVLNKELTPTTTSPIMRSDFTNTIQMRKKSLENSLQKDKQLKPVTKTIRFEQPGKVNMLKNKFSHMQTQVSSKSVTATPFAKSKDCMDILKFKRKVVTEACPNQTASSPSSSSSSLHTSHSASLPNSPLPVRKPTACSTFRLSDRVREVTDRLAQQQTVSTEARKTQKSPSPTRKKILSP